MTKVIGIISTVSERTLNYKENIREAVLEMNRSSRGKNTLERSKNASEIKDERAKYAPNNCSHYFIELLNTQALNKIPLSASVGVW